MSHPLLSVHGLSMHYGGIKALEDVSLTVKRGSITALIGPNGAGKTTLFNCLTGFYRATRGQLLLTKASGHTTDLLEQLGRPFCASDLVHPSRFARRLFFKMFGGSHRVCRAGIARTFQNIRLFREMSVVENLLVAQHQHLVTNPLKGVLGLPSYRQAERNAVAKAHHWLKTMQLEAHANRLAGELPYGLQRKVEIARAMCTNPSLICLDEPAAGLNPAETSELKDLIAGIRDQGTTVLLIEHDMALVMELSEHIIVLDHGAVIAVGEADEIRRNPAVLAAYLGQEEHAL